MRLKTSPLLLLLGILLLGLASIAPAREVPVVVDTGTPTSIRSSAILTNADVLSTTFTLDTARVTAVHVYADAVLGSLGSMAIAPAGASTGNPLASGYYKSHDQATTFTANGSFHVRIPKENFGASTYGGIYAIGVGTASGSSLALKYKLERIAP